MMRDKNIRNDPAYLFQYVMDISDGAEDSLEREKKKAADISHFRPNILQNYSLPDKASKVTTDGEPIIMGSIYNGERLWR